MTASIGGTQQGPATHILRMINQVIETQWHLIKAKGIRATKPSSRQQSNRYYVQYSTLSQDMNRGYLRYIGEDKE